MQHDYWQKQETGKPLFEDILWSRPENTQTAGKLLIIGGNSHGFAQVALAYETARQAGAGAIKILLPDVLQKTVSMLQTSCYFAPSNPSGGFSKQALAEMLDHAHWADAVLLAGEFGRNSETAVTLELFIQKYSGKIIITRDTIDYFISSPKDLLLQRPETCFVGSVAQLQKLALNSGALKPISFSSDLSIFVDSIHELSATNKSHFVTKFKDQVVIAVDGKISTTPSNTLSKPEDDIWRVPIASKISVFWLQNPTKPFEAFTTAVL